jgi:hypothetical protein
MERARNRFFREASHPLFVIGYVFKQRAVRAMHGLTHGSVALHSDSMAWALTPRVIQGGKAKQNAMIGPRGRAKWEEKGVQVLPSP